MVNTDNKIFNLSNRAELRVRYAETDKMGIVYNGIYFTYFEVGRCELFRAYNLPYTLLEEKGIMLPLIEAHIEYVNPSYYDDLLEIESYIAGEIGAKITFAYNIFRAKTTIAKGYTVHSFMNSETRKAVRPPSFFLEALKKLEICS